MLRQITLRSAASASSRLLSTPALRPFPITSTARCLSTETTMSTSQTSRPPSSASAPAASKAAPKAAPSQTTPRKLTYLVEKTASQNLAVYSDTRSGGTRKETVIRKIVGRAEDLKKDLITEFKFKKDDVNINPVTGHIRIKGSYEAQIKQWLQARGF